MARKTEATDRKEELVKKVAELGVEDAKKQMCVPNRGRRAMTKAAAKTKCRVTLCEAGAEKEKKRRKTPVAQRETRERSNLPAGRRSCGRSWRRTMPD